MNPAGQRYGPALLGPISPHESQKALTGSHPSQSMMSTEHAPVALESGVVQLWYTLRLCSGCSMRHTMHAAFEHQSTIRPKVAPCKQMDFVAWLPAADRQPQGCSCRREPGCQAR
eukprot:scaffold166893_cov17-Tisochrysis_lutea.AAC.1